MRPEPPRGAAAAAPATVAAAAAADDKVGDRGGAGLRYRVHRVFQGAAQRGPQFDFILAVVWTLFHMRQNESFLPLKLAPLWREPPDAQLEECHKEKGFTQWHENKRGYCYDPGGHLKKWCGQKICRESASESAGPKSVPGLRLAKTRVSKSKTRVPKHAFSKHSVAFIAL